VEKPLLLIIGLSFSLLDWGTEFLELLAKHYQVVLFGNRDAGKTDWAIAPFLPQTVPFWLYGASIT